MTETPEFRQPSVKPLPPRVVEVDGRAAVTIRYAVATDAERVAELYVAGERLAYAGHAPEDYIELLLAEGEVPSWKEQIGDPGHFLYVAEVGRELIGFANGGFAAPGQGVLSDTWVDSNWHGTGVAYELADSVLKHLQREGATVALAMVYAHNVHGDKFCTNLGFVYKGHRERVWLLGGGRLPDLKGPFGEWELTLPQRLGEGVAAEKQAAVERTEAQPDAGDSGASGPS